MRLTLRTLLAHEHGLLNETQAAFISQKIEQSPFVSQLLRHLRDRMQRREIVPFSIETRGHASLANVVGYLDHELSAESVVALENECFGSDRLLAEVAACHEILAQWLSRPTPLEPGLRRRLYEVVPSPDRAEPGHLGSSATWEMLPSALSGRAPAAGELNAPQASTSAAQASLSESSPTAPASRRAKRSGRRVLIAGFSLAASVAVMVTLGTEYREHFETLLKQHVRSQVAQSAASPTAEPSPRPESFVVGTSTLEPLDRPQLPLPADVDATADSQVATTAFHLPLENQTPAASIYGQTNLAETGRVETGETHSERPNSAGWRIEAASAALLLPEAGAAATLLTADAAPISAQSGARVIVASPGRCAIVHRTGHVQALGPAELRWVTEDELALRYGQLVWTAGDEGTSGEDAAKPAWTIAQQTIRVEQASADARIRLTTAAVALDGVNYAQDTANQEVWIECLRGTVKLTLSSCEGALSLEEGAVLAAHRTAGVRSAETAEAPQTQHSHLSLGHGLETLPSDADALANLRQLAEAEAVGPSLPARQFLAQLDEWDDLTAGWNREIPSEQFARHAQQLRQILAQDQPLAGRLEAHLVQAYPEHGALVFRLICGFSADQRSEMTLAQLRSLTQHPEASVRQWAAYQLALDGNFAPAAG